MPIQLTIPARVNILGNASDGLDGDFATISAAISLYARATVEIADEIVFESGGEGNPPQSFSRFENPIPYGGTYDLLAAGANRLYSYSPEFREKLQKHGVKLSVWSDVPRQSGLGGSSLFILLALAGLRELYDLDRKRHNDYVLAELTQRAEARELGIVCGYADRYVPLFGGLAYLDYRGKLEQREIGEEPYVVYERLDGHTAPPPLVAMTTGVQHNSGDVHGRMRPRYMEEHTRWKEEGGDPPPMVRLMSEAWESTWRGKMALLEGDLKTFGKLMNENHQQVDAMMRHCGFEDGAGWANNLFIREALEFGALGAKLTGAGGGGSVFALVEPGGEDALMRHWRGVAETHNLAKARVYPLEVSREGLVIEAG